MDIGINSSNIGYHLCTEYRNEVGDLRIRNVIYMLIFAICGFCSMVGNSLNIAVILKSKSLRTPTGILLVNLAFTDFCVGFWALLFTAPASYLDCWPYDEAVLQFCGYSSVILFSESIYMISAVAVDRCLCIIKPLQYINLFNYKTSAVIISTTWIFNILNYTLSFPSADAFVYDTCKYSAYYKATRSIPLSIYYMTICFLPTAVTTFVCYFKILKTITKLRRTVHPYPTKNGKNIKLALSLLSVTVVTFLNHIPNFIVDSIRIAKGNASVDEDVVFLTTLFLYINSLCNCIIYNVTFKPLREKSKEFLMCKKNRTVKIPENMCQRQPSEKW